MVIMIGEFIVETCASRNDIADIIGVQYTPCSSEYKIINSFRQEKYTRYFIEYDVPDDKVYAYLLIPDASGLRPAILIKHQHNGERFLGKSEVCGLAGNPLQAFGPILAQKGFVVLAPDSICFEDRRKNTKGIEPLPGDDDLTMGHSYGGNTALFLAALDERIHFACASGSA